MSQFVFILGRNPELSVAEIMAVLPDTKMVVQTASFLLLEVKEIDCPALLRRLGGTIKIGEVIGGEITADNILKEILRSAQNDSKLHFGVSFYDCKLTKIGFEVKKKLKAAGHNARLVTSKDKALSSVIVTKEHVTEFLVLQNKWLARTCAVQEFEEYGARDFGRPGRDPRSGMLPPKLAKIMINLAQQPFTATILDPFCGSGTILTEALLLGYQNVVGADSSAQAIVDSKKNADWLLSQTTLSSILPLRDRAEGEEGWGRRLRLLQSDVRNISQQVKQVDAVITEPFLGPPLRGTETKQEIEKIIAGLSSLYQEAMFQFGRMVERGGRVVIVFPWFVKLKKTLPVLPQIEKMGWKIISPSNLFYSRPDQHVWRQIVVLEKK